MSHINIPLFIPHEGCRNECVFCDQRAITGENGTSRRDIAPEIERALRTYHGDAKNAEIAFFGGSFTGIGTDAMTKLLQTASRYVEDGRVSSVRLSTRPDYIDDEILTILKKYHVTHIELGIQSTSEKVLLASKRGHTATAAKIACEKICRYGFTLGGQMMLGLPSSTAEDELKTARDIVFFGAKEARIYPTLVFESTALYRMLKQGAYTPLTLDEAVRRALPVYRVFLQNGVKVLRMGLQASDGVSEENVYAGPYHSAFGELVENALYRDILKEHLPLISSIIARNGNMDILCPLCHASKVAGQHQSNLIYLRSALRENGLSPKKIRIRENESIPPHTLRFAPFIS